MRTKNFLVFFCCVFASTIFLIIFGSQKPDSLQNIVSSTHQQIRDFQDNLRDAEQKNLIADKKYLQKLGFETDVFTYPASQWPENITQPCIVTYTLAQQHAQAIGLILSFSRVLVNSTILVYDIGLSDVHLQILYNYCNSTRCQVINTLKLSTFPSHVSNTQILAFRPLVIQDALVKAGAIIFVENKLRLRRATNAATISAIFNESVHGCGVSVQLLKNAITSLTHPKMFDYFHASPETFYFEQMVGVDFIVLVNKPNVHKQIMLPWVQCALTVDCIIPIGAQTVGCIYNKKPLYRYSGCHRTDQSALSIILTLTHNLNDTYVTHDAYALFYHVTLDKADEQLMALERNVTSETSSLPYYSIT